MDKHAGGRWTDKPVLPLLSPPPPDLIRVHGGARVVRVYNVDDPDPRRHGGFTEAVILAWAPRRDGGWGVLTAWLGGWQENTRTTGRGRWAWCLMRKDDFERGRVKPVVPFVMEGHEWHGHHPLDEVTRAMHEAAWSLPEQLREAALLPASPEVRRAPKELPEEDR